MTWIITGVGRKVTKSQGHIQRENEQFHTKANNEQLSSLIAPPGSFALHSYLKLTFFYSTDSHFEITSCLPSKESCIILTFKTDLVI